MNDKYLTLHSVCLFVVPALVGIAMSLTDLYNPGFLKDNVLISIISSAVLFGSTLVSTYLQVVYFDSDKKLYPPLVFFVYAVVVAVVFLACGVAVEWFVEFWPWR